MKNIERRVHWFFGRGLSIGCKLTWSVPLEWRNLDRDLQIARIKKELRIEMDKPSVDCFDIRNFLSLLSMRTVPPWRHLFLTTNWDFLLQREVLGLGHRTQPEWSAETHVFHLNGTVEILPDNGNRSAFVLETDRAEQRMQSLELKLAFAKIMWNDVFVVVGVSFECEGDSVLLQWLNEVEDHMPVGQSQWIIVPRPQCPGRDLWTNTESIT